MEYISYDQLGNYLETYNKQIILRHTGRPLFILRFADEQLARRMVLEINALYGEHLEWLGLSSWLADIRQIHFVREDRIRFGRFVTELINLNKLITIEDCAKCWMKSKNV